MNSIKKAARFWCDVKRFFIFLLGMLCLFLLTYNLTYAVKTKNKEKKNEYLKASAVSCGFVLFFTIVFFILGTEYGCYINVAENVYSYIT